jgi:hypothetical protein
LGAPDDRQSPQRALSDDEQVSGSHGESCKLVITSPWKSPQISDIDRMIVSEILRPQHRNTLKPVMKPVEESARRASDHLVGLIQADLRKFLHDSP